MRESPCHGDAAVGILLDKNKRVASVSRILQALRSQNRAFCSKNEQRSKHKLEYSSRAALMDKLKSDELLDSRLLVSELTEMFSLFPRLIMQSSMSTAAVSGSVDMSDVKTDPGGQPSCWRAEN